MATKKGTASSGPTSVAKSHRSFKPVLPCGNKLLQQKWDQTYYDDHKKLVKAAKPMVDSKPPPARPHVVSKLKKQQLERERLEVIDRDNMSLLTKMQRIMKTEGSVNCHGTSHQYRHSLNQEKRQREVTRVARENKQMLQRLQKVEPMYKVSNWINDWQRKEELTNMITAYPEDMIPTANKIKKGGVSAENSASEGSPVQVVDDGKEKNSKEQTDGGKEGGGQTAGGKESGGQTAGSKEEQSADSKEGQFAGGKEEGGKEGQSPPGEAKKQPEP